MVACTCRNYIRCYFIMDIKFTRIVDWRQTMEMTIAAHKYILIIALRKNYPVKRISGGFWICCFFKKVGFDVHTLREREKKKNEIKLKSMNLSNAIQNKKRDAQNNTIGMKNSTVTSKS